MRIINNTNKHKKRPIECPECKSKNIAIITEYHKSIISRIIKSICLILLTVIVFNNLSAFLSNNEKLPLSFTVILILILLLTDIIQQYIEGKTHIQCVCKDCGSFWLHDE